MRPVPKISDLSPLEPPDPRSRRTRLREERHVLSERGYGQGRRAQGKTSPLIRVLGERSYEKSVTFSANAATGVPSVLSERGYEQGSTPSRPLADPTGEWARRLTWILHYASPIGSAPPGRLQ